MPPVPFRRFAAAAIAFTLAGPATNLAWAQPAEPLYAPPTGGVAEAATAFHHTELAYKAGDINSAHDDLQQAVNCLVGPGDKRFSAASKNPCASQGSKGAIRDIKDAALGQQLQLALGEISLGLESGSLRSAQMDALSAMDFMKSARIDDSIFPAANVTVPPSR